ncbi:MAG: hypothetical protein E6J90_31715 [Deltaproteobacteria bacterium]|nr:MAG: hypothetical protein E6J91_24675 [Deltaproteobacteria bacterium]TMQ12335.1 MAG: hypothetical protein E6J90_31715 [Deltaproteobacteria bacterium]
MTVRARRETDEGVGVFGPGRRAQAVEQATPTHVDAPISQLSRATDAAIAQLPQGVEQATPTELMARPERSEPIRVISMKERAASQPRGDATPEPRVPLHVQLRTMAEVAGVHDRADLGHLAPPRDPRRARARRWRDNVVWGCIALALACGISLVIWLLAGR